MAGIGVLMGMVATEAVEANWGQTDHCFDERNDEYVPPYTSSQESSGRDLPPIPFALELIENPDGSLEWIE